MSHIHIRSDDPRRSAEWWEQALGFAIVRDQTRVLGDRFIVCETANGVQVNISGPLPGETFGPSDPASHLGLDHFGLDSEDIDLDIERLTSLGATLVDGPTALTAPPGPTSWRICFLLAPDGTRFELSNRVARSREYEVAAASATPHVEAGTPRG